MLDKIRKSLSSIRAKIVLIFFVIILLTLFFISAYIFATLKDYFTNQKKVEYLTRANVISSLVAENMPFSDNTYYDWKQLLGKEVNTSDIRVMLMDSNAVVMYDSGEGSYYQGKAYLKSEVITALEGESNANISYEKETGWTFDISVPIVKNNETVGSVYIMTSAADIMGFVNDISVNLVIISILVSILIGILSAILAGVITEPIEKLTSFIISISQSEKIPQINMKRNDEIGQLADAFNEMGNKLNSVDEKKRNFIADVSHEIKTPLSTIKLLSDSICQMQDPNPEIVKEFLGDINNEVERLTKITEGLLIQTKLEFDQLEVKKTRINLCELISRIIDSLDMISSQKNISVEFHPHQDIFIVADYEKIWQAIFNITDNGIKYSNNGGHIEITATQGEAETQIAIKDNGIGIPQQEVTKIFEKFYRVDKARSRETGGTGLGLSIAQNAVMLHGGKIEVESVEGEGTTFRLLLPNGEEPKIS